MHHCHTIDGD